MEYINHDRLLELLDYDPDSGVFTWKMSRAGSAKIGSIAGSINSAGYQLIGVDGTRYLAHRLAWFYCFQEWPAHIIDHINGIKTDNRLDNLQDVTQNKNIQKANRKLAASGFRNVKKVGNRYRAQIEVKGKTVHLGTFDTGEQASEYAKAYKKENNL